MESIQTQFTYTYDGSGNNLLETNSKASSNREIVWTEENRIAAIKARGNVSHYVYDARGIRTLKMNSTSFNISINGVRAGATAVDGNFTIYANPYTVVRQNQCTKHFFLGSQRILTKISSNDVSKTFYEGNAANEVANVDYTNKQTSLEDNMAFNTEKLNIGWYRNTHGQVPSVHIKHYLLAKEYGGLSGQNPWAEDETLNDSTQVNNPTYEQKQYYYHPDHLGSSNYLTDVLGETYQHVEYLPWGETFLEERNTQTDRNSYLYTGKELDLLTGLYYYEQRYYDASKSTFLGVDPMAENFPWATPYSYCFNNPINSIDPDGREPITLSVLAVKGLIGAGIDISIQMTANMTLKNQSFGQAFRNIDWTSAGGSFVAGAVGIPGVTAISKTAKVVTIATAVAVDAAVDVSIAEGNQNIFNGEKSLTTASIDAVGSLIGGKASDDIVKGAKNSISNDISSGTFSTLNKAEKNTLRQTQTVVNSQGFEAGTKTVVGLGTEIGKQGAKSIVGSGNPSGNTAPLMQNYTQPSDNTRVVRPIYPLPEFK